MAIESYSRPFHNFVPEYQQSGIPWVYSGTTPVIVLDPNNNNVITNVEDFKLEFNRLTRWLIIHNHNHDQVKKHLRVYFSEESAVNAYNGDSNGRYFLIDGEIETNRLEVKCKYVYILPEDAATQVDYSIIAGLTSILTSDFPDQTSGNGFTGI